MGIDKNAIPAVFMFQPTEFEVLESDRLAEWERALAERVGLVPGPDVHSWPSTLAPSPPAHALRPSCSSGSPRGAVRHLGANVVVELDSESRARQPTTRAWAIVRRADRNHRLAGQRTSRPDRRHADRPPSRSYQSQERETVVDAH
jgi:hypothetical protein